MISAIMSSRNSLEYRPLISIHLIWPNGFLNRVLDPWPNVNTHAIVNMAFNQIKMEIINHLDHKFNKQTFSAIMYRINHIIKAHHQWTITNSPLLWLKWANMKLVDLSSLDIILMKCHRILNKCTHLLQFTIINKFQIVVCTHSILLWCVHQLIKYIFRSHKFQFKDLLKFHIQAALFTRWWVNRKAKAFSESP